MLRVRLRIPAFGSDADEETSHGVKTIVLLAEEGATFDQNRGFNGKGPQANAAFQNCGESLGPHVRKCRVGA